MDAFGKLRAIKKQKLLSSRSDFVTISMYFQADIFNDNLKTYCELRDESLCTYSCTKSVGPSYLLRCNTKFNRP